MVGSSGTAAVSPPRPPRALPSSGIVLHPSAFEPAAPYDKPSAATGALGAPIALADRDAGRRAETPVDRSSGSTTATSRSSRSNSFDLGSPTTPVTAKATTAVKVRPALRLNSHSSPQVVSISSSPQRRAYGNYSGITSSTGLATPSTAITTPSTGTSEATFWKSTPLQPVPPPALTHTATNLRLQPSVLSNSDAPVLPDLNLRRGDSYDLSRIPELEPLSPRSKQSSVVPSAVGPVRSPVSSPRNTGQALAGSPRTKSRNKEHHRTQSQKTMLASALQKANTAVTLDHAENYEGAMDAYNDACVLLSQVMQRAGGDEDRKKLQTIKDTYMQRIKELEELPPRETNERELPPRPLTEEFTDEGSLFTIDDDESTLGPSKPGTLQEVTNGSTNGNHLAVNALPPRRDSLYVRDDAPPAAEPIPQLPNKSLFSQGGLSGIPASRRPISPNSPPSPRTRVPANRDPLPDVVPGFQRFTDNRESFTFGAAALSPRYSLSKELDFGIRGRSGSGTSTPSTRSPPRSPPRDTERETGEVSTSWLNTIDESGSSAEGEFSPGWMRRNDSRLRQDSFDEVAAAHPMFEDDFDTQLDAAVEAAYDDGYEVDYGYDREEEELMMMSPRLNVEKAKERVREVEREMELEIQKDKERRSARDKDEGRGHARLNSDAAFYDDGDDDDSEEEERMLDEMTRGYTLDFDFNLDTKTALPRESASTTYSDSTFQRGSASSAFSGSTWGSSVSGHFVSSTSLTTVTEAPSTPPPVPPLATTSPDWHEESIHQAPDRPIPEVPSLPPTPGLAMSKLSGVRSRRLSALSEALEPLKIETSTPAGLVTSAAGIPTTIVRGPSPNAEVEPPPAPAQQPLAIHAPLNIPSQSPSSLSRPETPGRLEGITPESPELDEGNLISPPPPSAPEPSHGGLTAIPLTKAVSDDGVSGQRSVSPAKFVPRIPGLRQIQSSASLRSRNVTSPETEPPGTPGTNLFASSSTSNLRKAYPRSVTPATPGVVPGGMVPPPTAGLPTSGMNLFDTKFHSPDSPGAGGPASAESIPYPLEPCPADPLSKPYWLMRALYQTLAHPRGGYISTKLFVPTEVWSIKGVKIKSFDDKISACDLVTAALMKLGTVNQDDINAVYEEMQSLEDVLDRAQALLSKKLGSDVGAPGAKALYGGNEVSPPDGVSDMVTTKVGNASGGKSYFSLRKLRTKASNTTISSTLSSSQAGGDFQSSVPVASGSVAPAQQAKRDLASAKFSGPHAAYTAALARLFDSAQVLDQLSCFDEDASSQKLSGRIKIGLELSQRHAAEFFGLYICRFVLADISLLLDKFVKRGSEWVAQ